MSAVRLALGTHGDVSVTAAPRGGYIARARYRDWDGKARLLQATAQSRRGAEQALLQRITGRSWFRPSSTDLKPSSSFGALVEYWLEDLDREGHLSRTTRLLYERNMRTLVLPAFEHLELREIGVARCDQFVKRMAKLSYSRARHARLVLRLALALAVRHEVLPRNPMDSLTRLRRPARSPEALTPVEVNAIRLAIASWEAGRSMPGPKPDGQLGVVVEIMLGTSARIGEVLAIRRRDIDITSETPSIRIAGTIVSHKGEPTNRQDHPKTERSRRTIAIPTFTAEAVRKRLATVGDVDLDALLFTTREGNPLTTNSVRLQLRRVLKLAGISGVTPHMFRRTVATVINEQAGIDLAAELLGHTDTKVTIQHYIRRSEMVNPTTALLLDRLLGKAAGS